MMTWLVLEALSFFVAREVRARKARRFSFGIMDMSTMYRHLEGPTPRQWAAVKGEAVV
jgi:hypothetical protein